LRLAIRAADATRSCKLADCACTSSILQSLPGAQSHRSNVDAVCCFDLQRFSKDSLDFQERISARSGLGNGHACLPPALHILPKPVITLQARGFRV